MAPRRLEDPFPTSRLHHPSEGRGEVAFEPSLLPVDGSVKERLAQNRFERVLEEEEFRRVLEGTALLRQKRWTRSEAQPPGTNQ